MRVGHAGITQQDVQNQLAKGRPVRVAGLGLSVPNQRVRIIDTVGSFTGRGDRVARKFKSSGFLW